jgi:hypothetical protein
MKKKIVIGSILVISLIAMLPSACAIEFSAVKETMESQYPVIIPEIDIEELKEKYKDRPIEPTFIILFILSQILNILRTIKFALLFVIILIIRNATNNTTSIIC